MGIFSFLKRKKKEETPAAAADDSAAEGGEGDGGSAGDANLGVKVDMMAADISKINATISAFKEINKSTSERFNNLQEQMGEIRGTINDSNRTMGFLEVKATKAADLVESVHPDKLMIQVQKLDGKIEGLRAVLESKEAMIQNLLDQLRKARAELMIYQGVEQVIKMSEEVKTEILNAKKLVGMVERHADKVENVFIESQKTYREFNTFASMLESQKSELKEVSQKVDKMEIALAAMLRSKDFETRFGKLEKNDKHLKEVLAEVEEAYKKMNDRFEQLKGELKGVFDRRIYRAEVMSRATEQLIKENPALMKGLDLTEMFKDQPASEKKEEPKKQEGKEEAKAAA